MIDYSELKRLAEAVLASDDHADFDGWVQAEDAFTDAANPAAVLALIAELERQAAQFKEWQASHHRNYCLVADERYQLQAEVEALRKDAERYRWFRDCGTDWMDSVVADSHGRIICEDLDESIDAAMSKEAGQ